MCLSPLSFPKHRRSHLPRMCPNVPECARMCLCYGLECAAAAITCGRCPEPPPALRTYSEIRFHQNSRSSLRVHARWWGGPAGRSGSAGSSKRRTSKEQTRFTTTDTCTVATLGNGQSGHQNPASGLDSSTSNFRNSWERPPEKLPDMQSRSHAKIRWTE